MEILRYAGNAVLPLILEIFFGYFLRWTGLLDESFFHASRKLVFFVLLPCSVFLTICNVPGLSSINWGLTAYVFAAVLTLFVLGLLVSLFISDRRQRGIMIQAAYRSNYNIIAVPLAGMLGGEAGLAAAAVLSVTTLPQFNILAAISMSMFVESSTAQSRWKQALLEVLKNPLVLSSMAGLAVLLLREAVPSGNISLASAVPPLYTAMDAVAKMSTPMALITLGGLLDFRRLAASPGLLALGVLLRVLIAPLLGLGGAIWLVHAGVLSLQGGEYACMLAVFASPLATVTGVMAAQTGNDAAFADELVLCTTMISIFTLFGGVSLLRALGYI